MKDKYKAIWICEEISDVLDKFRSKIINKHGNAITRKDVTEKALVRYISNFEAVGSKLWGDLNTDEESKNRTE